MDSKPPNLSRHIWNAQRTEVFPSATASINGEKNKTEFRNKVEGGTLVTTSSACSVERGNRLAELGWSILG